MPAKKKAAAKKKKSKSAATATPSMAALLEEYAAWLEQERPDYFKWLQPGATDAALDALEGDVGCEFPEALRVLYRWRDGQGDYGWLAPVGDLNSLAEIKKIHQLKGAAPAEDLDGKFWSRSWIPFLSDGHGGHMCVDLGGSFGGTQGQVLKEESDLGDRILCHESLEAWLATVLTAIQEGILFANDEGGMELRGHEHWSHTTWPNAIRENKALRDLNPGYPRFEQAY